jgi:hypothetical protein
MDIDPDDCISVADNFHSGTPERFKFWMTVRDLMLAGFCVLTMLGCTGSPSAEIKARAAELSSGFRQHAETLAAKQNESLTILRENTNALAAIKSQVEAVKTAIETQEQREEVAQSSPPEVASELSAASTSRSSDVPLFVTYADFHCPPCERLREAIERGDFAGFAVAKSGPFEGQKSFPAVRYQDRSGTWKVRYGYDARLPQWIRGDIEGINAAGGAPLTGAMFLHHRPSAVTSQRSVVRFVPRRTSYNSRAKYQTRQSCPASGCPTR